MVEFWESRHDLVTWFPACPGVLPQHWLAGLQGCERVRFLRFGEIYCGSWIRGHVVCLALGERMGSARLRLMNACQIANKHVGILFPRMADGGFEYCIGKPGPHNKYKAPDLVLNSDMHLIVIYRDTVHPWISKPRQGWWFTKSKIREKVDFNSYIYHKINQLAVSPLALTLLKATSGRKQIHVWVIRRGCILVKSIDAYRENRTPGGSK